MTDPPASTWVETSRPLMQYRLDVSCRHLDGGTVLLGGSPLRLYRLTPAGQRLIDAIESGADIDVTGPAGRQLLGRLLDAGVIHPRPRPGPFSAADVTVIIPTFGRDVSATVAALGEASPVIVVDDGSTPPLPAPAGTTLVRSEVTRGPGAARMAGSEQAATPLVAFVDADVVVHPGWLQPLLDHFGDDRVGLVAPRVTSSTATVAAPAQGWWSRVLAAYESVRSPLDLGPDEARVRARTRVSYVPAAALVVRSSALAAVGGFERQLTTGEDVDLVWRLDEAGWRCRYEPRSVVHHEPRPTPRAWVAQRRAYGRSAGPLARRHPGALAPVAVSGWSAAAWGLAVAGWPVAGAALTGGTALALARKVRALRHPVPEAFRLAGLGTLAAGRQLAGGITRAWWPVAVGAAVVSRRARQVVVAVAIVPPVLEWFRLQRPRPLGPVTYTALRVADDVAYGLGLWEGALAAGTAGPLLPDFASWPRPGRYERTPEPRPAAS